MLSHILSPIATSYLDERGFQDFIGWVIKNTKLAIPAVYLMEATGIYYEQFAWFLYNKNCSVAVVLPNKAKKYSFGTKVKERSY